MKSRLQGPKPLLVGLFLAILTVGAAFLGFYIEALFTVKSDLPEAPAISPEGTEITIANGESRSLRASAARATSYQWTIQGEGSISATAGSAILFTAPEQGDGAAVVTVTAYNESGASPPTSVAIKIVTMTAKPIDSMGVPAGWMSGGPDAASFISLATSQNCHTGPACLKIEYKPGGTWGGFYWWPLNCGASSTPDAWQKVRYGVCGLDIFQAGNFHTVRQLTFWARGDSGGEIIEFRVGAQDIPPRPGRSTGKIGLTTEWARYQIDLRGIDLTNAVGLFAWTATDLENPQGATFYVDDMQFEGVKQ